jgi:hypothetical protein
MWMLLLFSCRQDDPAPVDTTDVPTPTAATAHTGPDDSATPGDPIRAAFEAAGFTVGEGALVFSTMEGCCDPGANCFGNNPSTPYGTYALPPAPGEPPGNDLLFDDFGPIPPGLSRDVLMRPDEAFVWIGTMPPPAKYFGLVSNLGYRPQTSSLVIGSLGAVVNQQVVSAGFGGEPRWGQPVAVITSADPAAEAAARAALVGAGWDPAAVVHDRIAPVVHLGLDPALHDSLYTVLRVAVYDDPAAGAAWEAAPGRLVRLTPTTPYPFGQHPMPALLPRGAGTDELAWAGALEALDAALQERFGGPRSATSVVEPYWRETLACIDDGLSCTGDSRDRYVGISPVFQLPTPSSFVVTYGVNHELTGKASYSSVSVQTIEAQRGISSVDSRDMLGSARPYLDHPQVDDLYVAVFARDCGPFDGVCVEVPWFCPGGGPQEVLKITGRAYLEPSTGAAPVPEELSQDRLILVLPE